MKNTIIISILFSLIIMFSFCIRNAVIGFKNDWEEISFISENEEYLSDNESRDLFADWDIKNSYCKSEVTKTTVKPTLFNQKTLSIAVIKTRYYHTEKR